MLNILFYCVLKHKGCAHHGLVNQLEADDLPAISMTEMQCWEFMALVPVVSYEK